MSITKFMFPRDLGKFLVLFHNHYLKAQKSSTSKPKVGSIDIDLDIIIGAPSYHKPYNRLHLAFSMLF